MMTNPLYGGHHLSRYVVHHAQPWIVDERVAVVLYIVDRGVAGCLFVGRIHVTKVRNFSVTCKR